MFNPSCKTLLILDRQKFQMKKFILFFSLSAGDEGQVNLALVQASCIDSGVYGCTITNEYGTESTDCLLSAESMSFNFFYEANNFKCNNGTQLVSFSLLSYCVSVLRGMCLREDLGGKKWYHMSRSVFFRCLVPLILTDFYAFFCAQLEKKSKWHPWYSTRAWLTLARGATNSLAV